MQDDLYRAPAPAARRRWPWVLGGLALLFMAMVVATTLVLLGLIDGAREGLSFIVDGEPFRIVGPADWFVDGGTVLGAIVAAVVVVVVVPLVLLTGLLCVVLAVGLGLLAALVALAVGLGCVLLVAALGLSPLWGLVLLLWLLLRSPRKAPAATGAGAV